jgi:hypothetical protein
MPAFAPVERPPLLNDEEDVEKDADGEDEDEDGEDEDRDEPDLTGSLASVELEGVAVVS